MRPALDQLDWRSASAVGGEIRGGRGGELARRAHGCLRDLRVSFFLVELSGCSKSFRYLSATSI